MHLHRLSLTNFRNYARLELSLPAGLTIIQGQNAQGKSNLLEAIAYLATGRSPRTNSDAELVHWLTLEDPYPYARVAAEIQGASRHEQVDITLIPSPGNGRFRKQVRINGVNKRALDLIGLTPVVLFRPEDVDLVAGPPSLRRRYLDIALCQMSAPYCRALSQYNKVLGQRNALLRSLSAQGGDATAQLKYWDEKLAETGGFIIARRLWLVERIDRLASLRHLDLSNGFERLRLCYQPSVNLNNQSQAHTVTAGPGDLFANLSVAEGAISPQQARAHFLAQLHQHHRRDLAAGMTLTGPHRDDMGFFVSDQDLRSFGSRGQQRTAALASKLAEIEIMTDVKGEPPLLLLDDVMSELDAMRRAMLHDMLASVPQAIVTTTDWDHFANESSPSAYRLQVQSGQLTEWGSGRQQASLPAD